MCAGSEFQVNGAGTENAREVKLLHPVRKKEATLFSTITLASLGRFS